MMPMPLIIVVHVITPSFTPMIRDTLLMPAMNQSPRVIVRHAYVYDADVIFTATSHAMMNWDKSMRCAESGASARRSDR